MDTQLLKKYVVQFLIGAAIGWCGMFVAELAGFARITGLMMALVICVSWDYLNTKKQEKEQGRAIEDFIVKEVERRSSERR